MVFIALSGCTVDVPYNLVQLEESPRGSRACWIVQDASGLSGDAMTRIHVQSNDMIPKMHESVGTCELAGIHEARAYWQTENALIVALPKNLEKKDIRWMLIQDWEVDIQYRTFEVPEEPRQNWEPFQLLDQEIRPIPVESE